MTLSYKTRLPEEYMTCLITLRVAAFDFSLPDSNFCNKKPTIRSEKALAEKRSTNSDSIIILACIVHQKAPSEFFKLEKQYG